MLFECKSELWELHYDFREILRDAKTDRTIKPAHPKLPAYSKQHAADTKNIIGEFHGTLQQQKTARESGDDCLFEASGYNLHQCATDI